MLTIHCATEPPVWPVEIVAVPESSEILFGLVSISPAASLALNVSPSTPFPFYLSLAGKAGEKGIDSCAEPYLATGTFSAGDKAHLIACGCQKKCQRVLSLAH